MKERIQQAGFAAVLGGLAGAALTAHRGRAAVAAGTVAGAAGLAAADTVARARQRPNEIPALWSRILASGAMAAPLGWTADRLARSSLSRGGGSRGGNARAGASRGAGLGPVPVATVAGAAAGALGLRPQKVMLGPVAGALVGFGLSWLGERRRRPVSGAVAATAAVVGYRTCRPCCSATPR